MVAYKELYSGDNYLIHFRWADTLNVLFVTFMFGLGMPILFPIAAVNFMGQWAAERIILAYLVRQPAAMDDTLSKTAFDLAKWAPILLIFNGYWMLSNRQIFLNEWHYISSETQAMPSGHLLPPGMHLNWATPAYLMTFVSLVILFI